MKPILSLHVLMLVCPAPGFSHQQQPGVAEEEGREGREGNGRFPGFSHIRLPATLTLCEDVADAILPAHPRPGDPSCIIGPTGL